MDDVLADRVAVVTGAGSGIGRAVALAYARSRAKVLVSDIDDAGGEATVAQIEAAGGTASYLRADVGTVEGNDTLVRMAIERYGGLHVACNNAGIAGVNAPIGELPPDAWDRVIRINLSGVFYGMRAQIPAMLRAGGGAIVNMASILGAVGFRGSSAYVAAKHGIVGLTQNAALEYAAQGVRVNAVAPGFIRTPLLDRNLGEDALTAIAALHPIGRLGTAEEVAELVLWLSSGRASFVTGGYYPVDGGYLAQ